MTTTPTLELRNLPEGAAVAVYVTVPSDSVQLRIIRREDALPTHETDLGQRGTLLFDDEPFLLGYDGARRGLTDFGTSLNPLVDDLEYFYGVFSQDSAGDWSAAAAASVTPKTKIELYAIDPQQIVVQRLEEKILRLLKADDLLPENQQRFGFRREILPQGIRVIDAFPFEGGPKWPVVSVHVEKDVYEEAFLGQAGVQSVGDFPDHHDENRAGVFDSELAILGWTLNKEERAKVRVLLKAAIYEDLRFYERVGLQQLAIVGPADAEDFTLGAPIYNVVISLSCKVLAQTVVREDEKVLTATADEYESVLSGTLSGATATVLTDSSQSPPWVTNQWQVGFGGSAGHVVRMSSGAAAGQQRLIDSNTGTTLTVGTAFDPAPAAGDSYQILSFQDPQGRQVDYQEFS